jgi:hypothetical protein
VPANGEIQETPLLNREVRFIIYGKPCKSGSRRKTASELRRSLYFYLYRELGSYVRGRQLIGIGTTVEGMVIKEINSETITE